MVTVAYLVTIQILGYGLSSLSFSSVAAAAITMVAAVLTTIQTVAVATAKSRKQERGYEKSPIKCEGENSRIFLLLTLKFVFCIENRVFL